MSHIVRSWAIALSAVLVALLLAAAWRSGAREAAPTGPIVLAAASMHDALEDAADVWAVRGHPRPVLSFAASSALARQIEAGAPADIFVSADEDWMDVLERADLLRRDTRAVLATNRLVIVASAGSGVSLTPNPGFPLAEALGAGRLAVAETETVPAGRYARAALVRLGVWDDVADRLAPAENVRAALQLVARGAAPLGIAYATDAASEPAVRIAGTFPPGSHSPIRYPVALLKGGTNAEAEAFQRFLLSDEGAAIFARHGFGPAG
ncbi:MAG: molybdate ABC transporter substrate-binding protein [Croceicoccus sp.]|nr:molybdate ABC transporter substrate-binding protein [Croceicoccus sp.]MAL25889.1 molybdate ABC transporter substrate-binding protein [Croceicoccus sp.]